MRQCILIDELDFGKRKFCIDQSNFSDIKEAFEKDKKLAKKFYERAYAVGRGLANREIYEKLSGFNTIWEIRLFKQSKGRNYRIYCKQIKAEDQTVYIILVEILRKKSQKIPAEVRKKLKRIDNYEYTIQQ